MITNIKSFDSDNNSGVHTKVLEAIISANRGHIVAYDAKMKTKKLQEDSNGFIYYIKP